MTKSGSVEPIRCQAVLDAGSPAIQAAPVSGFSVSGFSVSLFSAAEEA